ncbi:SusC/RagA family TonB-linked outer membrane protein [Pedobacter sp. JY14-1]|uniref:SusC/RagA family TonB-linked outer membrane protein n=1 Tax=Pedobacter sp. JY14-1 TaxID=3034151 RepID=UPI0023E1B5F0|nr:SusC/RagA family TonB-linked outer membrane protein [Pedobacter sp. JY14-1]
MKLYYQLFRIMKLTAFIIAIALVQVSATTKAQITLDKKNARLREVLQSIGQQSGYDFLYNDAALNSARRITIKTRNESLEAVLKACFENQPLTYTIEDKTVVIKQKEASFLDNIVARFQAIDVRGKVVDSLGNGLAGATVSVKNGKGSTSTDAGGSFQLKNVDEGAVLVVNYLGYVIREVASSKEFMNVVLQQSESKLDEVQIQAYGVTSRRLSTGNISSVKAEDIAKQPVTNPLLALAGRVPGLEISQSNGLPGSGVRIRIQGTNSIRSNANEPFYVIDGVPYPSTKLVSTGQPGDIGHPMNFINPQDIESIEVLKDAAATSIYGSRAQNGAILITTKKGKFGKAKIDFNLQTGFGRVAKQLDLMDTKQYVAMRKEAFSNDGIDFVTTFPFNNKAYQYFYAPDILLSDTNRYTDWQKELIGGSAEYHNAQVSISGGSTDIQYMLNGNYHKETTVFPGDRNDQKGSVHFNINSNVNERLRITVSGSYMADINNLSSVDLTSRAMTLRPNGPDIYLPDGSLNWEMVNYDNLNLIGSTFSNPLGEFSRIYRGRTNNLLGNGTVAYKLLSKLNFRLGFGYNRLVTDEIATSPSTAVNPVAAKTHIRTASYGDTEQSTWNVEPQLNYANTIGNGRLDFLAGTSIQQTTGKSNSIFGQGYNNDLVLENMAAAQTLTSTGVFDSAYKYFAIFGRLNYVLSNRYIVELSARRDGSSRFGDQNKFHNFAALSGAWIFSNVLFLKENFPVLSFGKLKASYGTSGSDQIGDYVYLSQYWSNGTDIPYGEGNGQFPIGLANPYIQWEETKKVSVGIDLGFFRDRILLNATYFRNRSGNQLVSYKLPSSTGFTLITSNFPAVIQNTGIEFSLNTQNIRTKDFDWTSAFNITIPNNKLLSFPDLENSSYANELVVGQPMSYIKLFDFAGVDPATGMYKYSDKNGNLTSRPDQQPNNDHLRMNTAQSLYGGLQNSFKYKCISLDFLIQFVKQNGPSYLYGSYAQGRNTQRFNDPVWVLNRWKKPGDITSIGQFTNSNTTIQNSGQSTPLGRSTAVWGDASFIRFKNVSLTWELPQAWRTRLRFQNAKLFVLGQNLFTITNYKGLDPESKSSTVLPPLRVITFGTNFTF